MMKSTSPIFSATLAAALMLVVGSAQAISLTGDAVTVELFSTDGGHGVQNVLVGAGEDGNYFGNQFYDLDAGINNDIFSVRSTSGFSGGIDGLPGTIEWRLTGLDFTGGSLLSVNILQPYSNVTVSSLGPNNVTFSYTDIAIPQGIYFQAQFLGTNVPEPASLALLGLGLAGVGLGRRKKV